MNRNLRHEKRLHFAPLSILHNEDFSLYDLTITKRTCERGGLWKFAVYWFLKLFFTDRYMYLLRKPTKSDGNGNLWLTINKNRVRTIFFLSWNCDSKRKWNKCIYINDFNSYTTRNDNRHTGNIYKTMRNIKYTCRNVTINVI